MMHSYKNRKQSHCTSSESLNPCFNGWCTRTSPSSSFDSYKAGCLNPCFNGWCTRTNRRRICNRKRQRSVLILVLMDDALVHDVKKFIQMQGLCLNPCFNGWCTRTRFLCQRHCQVCLVLILVLMDDALVPNSEKELIRTNNYKS